MHKPFIKLGLLAVSLVALSAAANAAPANSQPDSAQPANPRASTNAEKRPQRPPHPPPKEAQDACSGKQEGADCSFKSPHGTLEGVCRTVKDDYFACVPGDAPPPPPED
ncbi:MAG: hypothetical protein H6718_09130 [Polyangiaceae bacterium]|nr:hypothetical protein [Myxococcales bacterium]MCB9585549.1 hypothetical protein [Polyangiaceae bacterium]MCB9606435.1 hypothetical protein [Polyangiaceae bacterium]